MQLAYCCSLRTFALLIGCAFLTAQTLLLAANFLLLTDLDAYIAKAFEVARPVVLAAQDDPRGFDDLKEETVRRGSDFLAIPVTVNIILMMSDSLLIWSTIAQHRILLWPWLVLHALEWLAGLAGLVWAILLVSQAYVKILLFLVVSPVLVIFAFLWIVVKCFYNYLRDLNIKEAVAAVYAQAQSNTKSPLSPRDPRRPQSYPAAAAASLPATVYSADPAPRPWDHPLPIWAHEAPPRSAAVWDPQALQKLDPRYVHAPRPGHAPSVSSSSRRRALTTTGPPTLLADGTLVVQIGEESVEADELTEIDEEDEEEEDGSGSGSGSGRTGRSVAASAVTSLSDKYGQQDEQLFVAERFPPATTTTS